jgi:hypothetical protein
LQQEISSLFYTQNGSTSEPPNSHGLNLIHRVSDTPGTDLLAYNYDESESEPTISFTENQDNDAQLRINDDVVLVLRGVDFRTLSESDVRLFPNKV